MKQVMRHTAISAAPVMSTSEFAGPVIGRPVTQINPMGEREHVNRWEFGAF
jgi:hypothetical protein